MESEPSHRPLCCEGRCKHASEDDGRSDRKNDCAEAPRRVAGTVCGRAAKGAPGLHLATQAEEVASSDRRSAEKRPQQRHIQRRLLGKDDQPSEHRDEHKRASGGCSPFNEIVAWQTVRRIRDRAVNEGKGERETEGEYSRAPAAEENTLTSGETEWVRDVCRARALSLSEEVLSGPGERRQISGHTLIVGRQGSRPRERSNLSGPVCANGPRARADPRR